MITRAADRSCGRRVCWCERKVHRYAGSEAKTFRVDQGIIKDTGGRYFRQCPHALDEISMFWSLWRFTFSFFAAGR